MNMYLLWKLPDARGNCVKIVADATRVHNEGVEILLVEV